MTVIGNLPLRLAPGQSRPLSFLISPKNPLPLTSSLVIIYARKADPSNLLKRIIPLTFAAKALQSPHKLTFLHPSGIVSYAILRPPSKKLFCKPYLTQDLPILLSLHGAGLEASDPEVTHALDSVPDLPAWVLFPTGVTPWCGDDWRTFSLHDINHVTNSLPDTWGFADVEAGAAAIKDWIKDVDWKGPPVDTSSWLVSGHSNGGKYCIIPQRCIFC